MIHTLKDGRAFYVYLPDADKLNQQILDGFEAAKDLPETRKTHFFEGRYENIYIDRDQIEGLSELISRATATAADILKCEKASLQCGFWFNSMGPGHVTIAHTHDDDDELLSGVYYVSTPENSGNLFLGSAVNQLEVKPEAGKMVFFKPNLIHEVSENKSPFHRLSIGMNFGSKTEI